MVFSFVTIASRVIGSFHGPYLYPQPITIITAWTQYFRITPANIGRRIIYNNYCAATHDRCKIRGHGVLTHHIVVAVFIVRNLFRRFRSCVTIAFNASTRVNLRAECNPNAIFTVIMQLQQGVRRVYIIIRFIILRCTIIIHGCR